MSKKPAKPIVFYSFPVSGHAHRVELLLRALDLRTGLQHSPETMRGKNRRHVRLCRFRRDNLRSDRRA